MTTLQDAKNQSVQLQNELKELRSEFAVLATALRMAADEVEENGVPPAANLQTALESVSSEFANQRQQVLKFANQCLGLNEKPFSEPRSIHDLESCLGRALEMVLKQQKEHALEPLRKAATINRHKGFLVPRIEEFRRQAQELFEKLQACEISHFEHELAESQKQLSSFSAMVDLIEGGELLDDEQCENLRMVATKFFEKTLVMAAVRGHLFLDRGAATPELPSLGLSSASSEIPEKVEIKPLRKKEEPKKDLEEEDKKSAKKEIEEEHAKAPSQFIGWPQNGWDKEKKEEAEKSEEKIVEKPAAVTSALESRKFRKDFLRPVCGQFKNFSEKCAALEKVLEKTPFHEIIMAAITQRRIDAALDFSRLQKGIAEGAIQALQDWAAMSKDLKATTHEMKAVLTACGFQVAEIRQERRHRVGFSAFCKLSENINFPKGCKSAREGNKYRISCFWGNPSEEMLLTEVNDALPDEIPLIFHFGRLSDERRLELARTCKENEQQLLILDDLLVLHLFSMTSDRLQELFDSVLPQSYRERLERIGVN